MQQRTKRTLRHHSLSSILHPLSSNLLLTTIAAIALATGSDAWGQGFNRNLGRLLRGGAMVLPEAAETDEEAERSVVLPENGDLRRKLDLVRGQIAGEHFAEAARALGQFLQDVQICDFFLRQGEERREGRSFLTEIRSLLHDLPEQAKTAYRAEFEPAARASLAVAIARGGEAPLREVSLRFPETRAADEARYRLALFLWDHGRPQAARGCLERLDPAGLEPPLARGRRLLLAASHARLGDREQADKALTELKEGDRGAVGAGSSEAPGELIARLTRPDVGNRLAEDWTVYRGNAERNQVVLARAPFLAPRWSRPATADAPTQLALERALEAHRQGTATCLPLLAPLAVGDLVFVRTARGVAAFDLLTGRARWRSPPDEDDTAGQNGKLFQEPCGGAFAADEECVYLLEEGEFRQSGASASSGNVLSALEHARSREGNLRWRVGGALGGDEPKLAGALFLGPPLSFQGRLYVLAEQAGALLLVILDRASGRQEWAQELALLERPAAADPERLLAGASPSISGDEIVLCPTSGGAVIAVDLATQSLLWAYRYARQAARQPSGEDLETTPRLDQYERWLDSTITIANGFAILTPAESRELHCLDLKNGALLWSQPRGDGMFIALANNNRVVVVERKTVRCLELADGNEAWRANLPKGAFPAGRGVSAPDRYFLPVTSASVLELDLVGGKIVREHNSLREVPVGNLIWHKGLFISQGPLALEAFDERDWLVENVSQRLREDASDAEALIRRGELDLAEGNALAAINVFRKAHEVQRSPRTKTRLISALLDGVRRKLPESAKLSAELDELIGP